MDRKGFVRRACLSGACICGFGAITLKAADNMQDDDKNPGQVADRWLTDLLGNLDQHLEKEDLKKILKMSAAAHYDHLKMDEMLEGYSGRMSEFIGFLEKEWGWKVNYDESAGVITADENKPYCVCPVLKGKSMPGFEVICYCSEGFAERMFSKVAGAAVSAEVISSVRRGDKSCIYRISLPRS